MILWEGVEGGRAAAGCKGGGILNPSLENCGDNCMEGAGKNEGKSPIILGFDY